MLKLGLAGRRRLGLPPLAARPRIARRRRTKCASAPRRARPASWCSRRRANSRSASAKSVMRVTWTEFPAGVVAAGSAERGRHRLRALPARRRRSSPRPLAPTWSTSSRPKPSPDSQAIIVPAGFPDPGACRSRRQEGRRDQGIERQRAPGAGAAKPAGWSGATPKRSSCSRPTPRRRSKAAVSTPGRSGIPTTPPRRWQPARAPSPPTAVSAGRTASYYLAVTHLRHGTRGGAARSWKRRSPNPRRGRAPSGRGRRAARRRNRARRGRPADGRRARRIVRCRADHARRSSPSSRRWPISSSTSG